MRRACALAFVMLLSSFAACAADTTVTLYRDGYAEVEHFISSNGIGGTTEAVLLTGDYENLSVITESFVPVYYDVDEALLVVYTLGEDTIVVRYETAMLTSKDGALWTVSLDAGGRTTLQLPASTTIVSVDPMPSEIDLDAGTLTFSGGALTVDYYLELEGAQQEDRRPSGIALIAIPIAGAVVYLLYRKRRKSFPWGEEEGLDALEKRVLRHVWERGRVRESDLRKEFNIPKTSAWRMMKRLEEGGYITIEDNNGSNVVSINR